MGNGHTDFTTLHHGLYLHVNAFMVITHKHVIKTNLYVFFLYAEKL